MWVAGLFSLLCQAAGTARPWEAVPAFHLSSGLEGFSPRAAKEGPNHTKGLELVVLVAVYKNCTLY